MGAWIPTKRYQVSHCWGVFAFVSLLLLLPFSVIASEGEGQLCSEEQPLLLLHLRIPGSVIDFFQAEAIKAIAFLIIYSSWDAAEHMGTSLAPFHFYYWSVPCYRQTPETFRQLRRQSGCCEVVTSGRNSWGTSLFSPKLVLSVPVMISQGHSSAHKVQFLLHVQCHCVFSVFHNPMR